MSMIVADWLERHGLGRHAALLAENDIGCDAPMSMMEKPAETVS